MDPCPHGPTKARARYADNPVYTGWEVDADYYGMHHTDRNAARYYGCPEPTWSVEIIADKATADRIVRNGDRITAALADAGHWHARLWVRFDGTRMTVTEYDYRRFELEMEAAQ